MSNKVFWYAKNGEKYGTYTPDELKELALTGAIDNSCLIWKEGFKDWLPSTAIKGLLPLEPPPIPKQTPPPLPSQNNNELLEITTEQLNDSENRIYHAPRLDSVFDVQGKILKQGKTTFLYITLACILGKGLFFIALIGLMAYWAAYYSNKAELEKIEKELYRENQRDGLAHDISDMRCFWLKYGAGISYLGGMLAVVFVAIRWFWNYRN